MSKTSKHLLVCDEMIIPLTCLATIEKSEANKNYSVCRINPITGAVSTWKDLSEKGFNQMKENLLKEVEYRDKIRMLERKIKLLEQHIAIMPGGIEYLMVKDDFEDQSKKQEKEKENEKN